MRKIINIVTGCIFGLAPLAVVVIFGVLIYNSNPNIIGIAIIGVLVILAIWLGTNIFKRVQAVGPIEFMSIIHASPDLDNLEPGPNSETKRRYPNEIVDLIDENANLFKGGSLRIYGDWFGKPYDNHHKISKAQFDKISKILTIEFNEKETLEIHNPRHIFEATTFLKVIGADRIKWSWYNYDKYKIKENLYYLDYKKSSKNIQTDTNVDWYKPAFNVSLGDPALMIYG